MGELANYGALGVIVILFATGLIYPKPTVDRVISERDRAESQRDAMAADMLERVAPLLERAVDALKARDQSESDVREVLVDVRRMLERDR